MNAFTICAVNYLAFATVLGNSFLDKNPNSKFYIFVVDGSKLSYEKNARFTYLDSQNLDIPKNEFLNMTLYYDVTELSTALKPSVFKTLFNEGLEDLIYLDPDIQVFSELTEISEVLKSNDIVLTPHTLNPIPRDGLRPSESDILESGAFNLGFLALRKSEITINFLDWWEERLKFDAIVDPSQMLFTDQRWIDLAPSYFPNFVIRHPGYNVAYWNLHERIVSEKNNEYFVNGFELKFFHFSGYRPNKPWILSKYVSNNPRVKISDNPTVGKIFEQYGSLANDFGWNSDLQQQYGFADFGSRKSIPSSVRRLYREDCIAAYKIGEILSPPENWKKWATCRSSDSGNLSRILFSIWNSRPDLKHRFPDAPGKDSKELQNWAKKYGVSQYVIDEDLIEINSYDGISIPLQMSNKKGVNIAGYLKGELGVGQSARIIYSATKKSGLGVSAINYSRLSSRTEENLDSLENDIFYPITIAVINADQFKIWANDFGLENIKNSTIIGVWAWETEEFPETMKKALKHVDEIWAISQFVKSAIEKHTEKPVLLFPTPITEPEAPEILNREDLPTLKNKQYNLFIFDYLSVFNRKNPLGIIIAHKKAFPNQDGPLLVIKSINAEKDSENSEKLKNFIKDRDDIVLIENYMSRSQLNALMNECLCYVSLHRSEGYGLTMAEAMSLGKPVIATGYSGNLEFMNNDNSLLVPYRLTWIGEGSFPYNPKSVWAEPDLEVAADYMKKIFTDSDFAGALGHKAKNSVLRNHSSEETIDFILNRINYHKSFFGVLDKTRIHVKGYLLFIVKEFIKSNIKFLKTVKRYSTYD